MIKTLEKIIIKIPILGPFIKKTYRFLLGKKGFKTSNQYWEDRYKSGGNSGTGSYNNLASFKADIINDFLSENEIKSVIEFGCGDGNQLKYFHIPFYTGIDVSSTIINKCKEEFKNDSTKQFFSLENYVEKKHDVSMSLDVIYHLVEDDVFHQYMTTLFNAAEKYVIIYSSNYIDKEYTTGSHVKHRKFDDWISKNTTAKLHLNIPNKYQYNGDEKVSSLADFYIYKI